MPSPSSASEEPYPVLAANEPRPVRPPVVRSVRERRLGEFVGGQYGSYNLASVLFKDRTDKAPAVTLSRWTPKAGSKPPFSEAVKQDYEPLSKGDSFGPSWTNHWVKLTAEVPKEWKDEEMVELEFDPSCEALIFSESGVALQGITGGFQDTRRVDFPLTSSARKQSTTFYIEVTCNGMFGVPSTSTGSDPDPNQYFALASADIVVKRAEAWKLLWDYNVLRGCVNDMPRDGVLQNKALWVANEIQNVFRKGDVSSLERCRLVAEEVLGSAWEKQGPKLYDEPRGSPDDALIFAIGHTHIDSAWLWPFSATQQKVARSWSTQLDLIERFPEYRFTASTAQQYAWLEELYPELFKRVQDAAKKGTFQPLGGTWVECDANMPSGEAFVRQFLYGQRFFKTRFGKRSDIFWLPDTFGYSGNIPQLARSAGCTSFFTQKLSWNNINKFPHHTFLWVGLDGTQILTHMTPVDNYDSSASVADIVRGVKNNRNLDVQPTALLLHGWGDGGGGSSRPHLEALRRARAINNNGYREMPKIAAGGSVRDFFDGVLKRTDAGKRLPSWSGEIYLEFHRGVYTSHGSIKRWNRRLEVLLHNIEWVTTLASLRSSKYDAKYPKEQIDSLWEPLLLNQFHDVLPGSSIRLVYDDAERIYADIARRGLVLYYDALEALATSADGQAAAKPAALRILNTLDFPRSQLVQLPLSTMKGRLSAAELSAQAVQIMHDEGEGLFLFEDATGGGVASLVPEPMRVMRELEAVSATQISAGVFELSSRDLRVRVSHGRISSIYDRSIKRELLDANRTAGLSICEDYPPQFDAWETELTSLETMEDLTFDEVRIKESGAWRSSLALVAKFGQSRVELTMSLDALPAAGLVKWGGRTALKFDARIDWQEKHRFLRFNVPTDLRAEYAKYEMQFGVVSRPTGRNTSWDAAKFEVVGHRWADLSEGSYGVALLTDSKYGYSVEGGEMRLSLLKAGTYPDAHQDEGKHRFTFAVYPHKGSLESSDVVNVARALNNPLEVSHSGLRSDIKTVDETHGPSSDPATIAMIERGQAHAARYENEICAFGGSSSSDAPDCFAGALGRVPVSTLQMPITIKPAARDDGVSRRGLFDDRSSVILDTVKRGESDFDYQGEKGKGRSVVLRLYESLGSRSDIRLTSTLNIKRVHLTNILEDRPSSAKGEAPPVFHVKTNTEQPVPNGEAQGLVTVIPLSFRGFEVKTVVLELAE